MIDRKDQVLLGDDFLKRDIYKATMEKINQNKLKNIVIVGGSHSGFSAAWLMLNGPATYQRMNSLKQTSRKTFPDAPLK
jgi:hypothetical protein